MAFPSGGGPASAHRFENFGLSNVGPSAVPTSEGTLYTATRPTRVTSFKVTNATAGSLDFTAYLVPAAGSAGSTNVIDIRTLATKTSADVISGGNDIILEAGDSIHVLGSGAGLTAYLSLHTER